MELRILGPLEVREDGRPLALGGTKQRALLAVLVLSANEVVSTDKLIDDLWGDAPPKTAGHSVQVYVSELRKVLRAGGEGDVLLTRPPGYTLLVDPDSVDARRFERLAGEGRQALARGETAVASAALTDALALWRGEPLADFGFEEFARAEIARLEELRIAVTEDRVAADLEMGRHADLVSELQSLVAAHPVRERLREHLMLALYRCGRQADALQVYAEAHRVLAAELGIDPGQSLQRLEKAILDQDPSLELVRAEPAISAEPPAAEPAISAPSDAPRGVPRDVRKIVTVVFTDVIGSSGLGERLDPESLRAVMGRYFDSMRTVLEHHGGTVEKFIGDAVMAVFGVPRVHEDDALRAVRAAAEMRDALAALNLELESDRGVSIETRTGVNTGEVVAGDPAAGQTLVTGDAVNVAARLEQLAAPGEILIGGATFRLVRDAVAAEPVEALSVRGKEEPVEALRILDVKPGAPGLARRLDSPIVGRDQELTALRQAFDRTVREGACHLFTVLGTAGVGKSRLMEEFSRVLGAEATVLKGRCLAYGDGITYWPMVEVVKEAAHIDDRDSTLDARVKLDALVSGLEDGSAVADGIAQMVGLTDAAVSPGVTFLAVRRLLEAMAEERPTFLIVEDIHWAEPTLLDLIESIADWSREAPILLVCTARPELLDERPAWGGGKLNATSILLAPLSDAETSELIENLLGPLGLPAEARDRIMEAAQGNPLFVEQMAGMMIDDGLLRAEGDAWVVVGDLSRMPVPAGIQTLLAARLDRLPDPERRAIEHASVIGRQFDALAVEALSPERERAAVEDSLRELARKDLLRPERSGPAVGQRFRFRHILIVNAAYESMPKRTRADLHERFADWMERTLGERTSEYEEILGYHLERAYRYHVDLGPVDEHGMGLARRAGERLASAGARAFARADMPGVVSLYSSASGLLPPDDPGRLSFLPDLGTALVEVGDMQRADEVFAEAITAAEERDDLRLKAHALLYRYEMQMWMDPLSERLQHSREQARQIIEPLERQGDDLSLSRCWRIIATAPLRYAEQKEATERAMEYARRAGDRRGQLELLQIFQGMLAYGPVPVDEALRQCDELLEMAAGDRVAESSILVEGRSTLLAMAGRIDEARECAARARATFRELGLKLWLAASGTIGPTRAELISGDPAAAEAILRESYEVLESMGVTMYLRDASMALAEALLAQGRVDEAERYVEAAASSGRESWIYPIAMRAAILSARGRHEQAEPLYRRALGLTDPDELDLRAGLSLDLGQAVAALGRRDEAVALCREALGLWERKGSVVGIEKATEVLSKLGEG